jgi:hypothetical protein
MFGSVSSPGILIGVFFIVVAVFVGPWWTLRVSSWRWLRHASAPLTRSRGIFELLKNNMQLGFPPRELSVQHRANAFHRAILPSGISSV